MPLSGISLPSSKLALVRSLDSLGCNDDKSYATLDWLRFMLADSRSAVSAGGDLSLLFKVSLRYQVALSAKSPF